jgi:hypothetical protein
MRRRVLIGAVAVVGAAAVSLNVWTDRGSDPTHFQGDFRAAVSAQVERTEALQASAKRALGGDASALTAVFGSMLAAAETSLGEYEHLRAPGSLRSLLGQVVKHSRAEVDAVERVIVLASDRSTAPLADALGDLGDVLTAREGAVQKLLEELRKAER